MNLSGYWLPTLASLAVSGFTPLASASADDCQFNLSQPLLDYGLMNRALRPDSAPERNLGQRQLSLSLNCSHPTDMSLFIGPWPRLPNVFTLLNAAAIRSVFAKRCWMVNR